MVGIRSREMVSETKSVDFKDLGTGKTGCHLEELSTEDHTTSWPTPSSAALHSSKGESYSVLFKCIMSIVSHSSKEDCSEFLPDSYVVGGKVILSLIREPCTISLGLQHLSLKPAHLLDHGHFCLISFNIFVFVLNCVGAPACPQPRLF